MVVFLHHLVTLISSAARPPIMKAGAFCGPGSLHFINGLYEANRNRAPVILIDGRKVQVRPGPPAERPIT
jgi:hypothetical protein